MICNCLPPQHREGCPNCEPLLDTSKLGPVRSLPTQRMTNARLMREALRSLSKNFADNGYFTEAQAALTLAQAKSDDALCFFQRLIK